MDLLPEHPMSAINVIEAYFDAYTSSIHDMTIWGMGDAEDIIRAKWIGNPETTEARRSFLLTLDWRQFEHIVERLYRSMGYQTRLTKRSRDGGRDVEAWKDTPGKVERLIVEAKLHNRNVGVRYPRLLLGVVSDLKANKGTLVSNALFTPDAIKFAESNRLELINGKQLVELLNEYLGSTWPVRVETLVRASMIATVRSS